MNFRELTFIFTHVKFSNPICKSVDLVFSYVKKKFYHASENMAEAF